MKRLLVNFLVIGCCLGIAAHIYYQPGRTQLRQYIAFHPWVILVTVVLPLLCIYDALRVMAPRSRLVWTAGVAIVVCFLMVLCLWAGQQLGGTPPGK